MNYEEGQALTLRWLGEAGLGAGARVLDIGCGPGNLARLVFAQIGTGGSLVGLDRDVAFLGQAHERHRGRDATFLCTDLGGELGTFDAIVGRRVLMYLSEPAATLRRLLTRLRPGGTVFFQEFILFDSPTLLPLHDRVRGWTKTMLAEERASWQFGRELPRVFAEAGLQPPVMRAEVDVAAPGEPDSLADRVRFVLLRLVQAGISASDIDTLAARLQAARDSRREPWFGELAVAAWVKR